MLNEELPVQVQKAGFLHNTKKKAPFIKILEQKLHNNSIITKQSTGDVDVLLVEAARNYACPRKSSVAAPPATDVLVILLHHWKKSTTKNIVYSTKRKMTITTSKSEEKKNNVKKACLHVSGFKEPSYQQHIQEVILFVHAFTACGVTSVIYEKG